MALEVEGLTGAAHRALHRNQTFGQKYPIPPDDLVRPWAYQVSRLEIDDKVNASLEGDWPYCGSTQPM